MIHPPDVIGKYAPDAVIGVIGEAAAAGGKGGGGGGAAMYSVSEVAKHTTKGDCWVILDGKVLNVTNFLSSHPGGELAILTFAGRDATEEFNMIHPPDVVGKYAPDAVIGVVGEPGAKASTAVGVATASQVVTKAEKGDKIANHHAWGEVKGDTLTNWRVDGFDDNPGVFIINVKSYVYAFLHLWVAIIIEVLKTIFTNKNFKIDKDRTGLTRSAVLLILFIVIHAVGNLHVFEGPDDFNGYGYFYVRLYWTGFGLPANIVEEYILLSALLHVLAGLKRTWDINLKKGALKDGKLSLAVSGLVLLTFMTVHLFQFRFGDTHPFRLRPPPYLIFFGGITQLQLFWTTDESVDAVPVRDIYRLEFDRFLETALGVTNFWAFVYILSVLVFVFHASWGWYKLVPAPAMGIPKLHQPNVTRIGYAIFIVLGAVYIAFPMYVIWYESIFGSSAICGAYGKGMTGNDMLNNVDCTN